MPPYEKQMLEKTLHLSEENNKILHRLQAGARWARFFGILKWSIIIAITVGAYYYIQPYLNALLEGYNNFQGATGGLHLNIPGIPGASSTQEFIKNLLNL